MLPRLLHLYGPLWIYSYGFMIALGFLVFLYVTYNHPVRKRIIASEPYLNVVFVGLLSGILGARLLFVVTEWKEFAGNWIEIFFPWVGGLVVLGGIVAILTIAPLYLWFRGIAMLTLFDLAALYAPLFEGISRLGCFFAGCCYGIHAPTLPWAVTFSDPAGSAPLHVPLHPTQIYMSLIFLAIFFIFMLLIRFVKVKPGQILFTYLMCENSVRFLIDFLRGDRGELISSGVNISQYQVQSLFVLAISIVGFILVSVRSKEPAQRFE